MAKRRTPVYNPRAPKKQLAVMKPPKATVKKASKQSKSDGVFVFN